MSDHKRHLVRTNAGAATVNAGEPPDTIPSPHLSPRQQLLLARSSRAKVVAGLRERLLLHSFPRLQMALIVGVTGATGLLWSYLLRAAGIDSMALRHPLALTGAYVVFLVLLWLWLHTKASDYTLDGNVPDFGGPSPDRAGHGPAWHSGGGGDFGGGGAHGHFDFSGGGAAHMPPSGGSFGDGIGDVAGAAADGLGELLAPILAVVLALGLSLASLYVVYVAPELFAEILFDGALSYTLYRRLRRQGDPHWLSTAVTATMWPFLLTTFFVTIVGAALSVYAPDAHTLSDAVHHVKAAPTHPNGAKAR